MRNYPIHKKLYAVMPPYTAPGVSAYFDKGLLFDRKVDSYQGLAEVVEYIDATLLKERLSAAIDVFGDREFITSSYGDHEELLEALLKALGGPTNV